MSSEASATVRIVPDPTFDCTDVTGKVFDDANRNGYQDNDETGLAGVRLVTARGLATTTDKQGRYHVTCAIVPNESRGSNFVLKLDDRSLPSGYRPSTRPVQVQRATRGKALRINFGASIHRVVGLDIADAVFVPDSVEMRQQWLPRINLLLDELKNAPSVLRLSYVADVESASLVDRRLNTLKQQIEDAWEEMACCYDLVIEPEVHWRLGEPAEQDAGGRTMNVTHFRIALTMLLLPLAVFAQDVDEAPLGEAVERHLSLDEPIMQWVQDPERVDHEASDTIELREGLANGLETIKLTGLVPPIYFETGVAQIPTTTVASLGEILDSMRDRMNVRLHLVGHADNQPLSPRLVAIYGDNLGLSRERAGEVAEHMQTALALPPEGVSYTWEGDLNPAASNDTAAGRAQNRRVEVEVWYDEVRQKATLEEVLVKQEAKTLKVCRMQTVCKLRYVDGHARRARVQNLIAPLYFDSESIDVSEEFVANVQEAFANLSGKQNVVVKFVGHTDALPLTGRVERIYGDPAGLSKARARRVALAVQDGLDLPTDIVMSDGRGADKPIASNDTARGRALNRRVEVEFWYDDPLQELPDEPQLCPGDAGAEMVTKVYDPPWGSIPNVQFVDGQPVPKDGLAGLLARALEDVADKTNPRLRFVGYTRNERLARRTAGVYGDDIGLSASRARRAMDLVAEQMQLDPSQREFEGRGFVHSDDVVNAGFVQGETSHVAVQVVYDELAILDDYEGVDITRMTRELHPENPLGLNLMRITVDGEPLDDPRRSSSDIQRCTDVALADVDIQFGYDNLRSAPRLSVTAQPSRVDFVRQEDGTVVGSEVRFSMYTNYSHFIERAEVRLFRNGQSQESTPIDIVDISVDGQAKWQPWDDTFRAPADELAYVLRVYGADGNFDETQAQPLWIAYSDVPVVDEDDPVEEVIEEEDDQPVFMSAFADNRLGLQNIGLSSGTVNVRGSGINPDQEVWVAGRPIPVDEEGSFFAEEVLPQGQHTVEVAVLDKEGSGELYLRDLEFEDNDWFYVGMADVTVSGGDTDEAMDLLQGANSPYDNDSTRRWPTGVLRERQVR